MEDLSAQSLLTRTTTPFAIDRAGIVVHDTSPYRHITRPSGVASIEYVVSGQGTVIENNSKFHVKSGDVFILHAGRYQDYFPDDEDPWTRIWVQLSGYIISDILRAYGLSHINHIPKFDIEADLRAIGEIIRLDTDQAVIDTEGPHLLISLLQKLQEELFRRDANRKNTSIARSMHRMIISNPTGSISLDEISQELNFSKRHLIRIFKDRLQHYSVRIYSQQAYRNRSIAFKAHLAFGGRDLGAASILRGVLFYGFFPQPYGYYADGIQKIV